MTGTISKIINLVRNMGWRYIGFRSRYELLRRGGLLKKRFPANPQFRVYCTLEQWKQQSAHFFFSDKSSITISRKRDPDINSTFDNSKNGKLKLFNSVLTDLGADYDWVTNPDTGFKYDVQKHWTEIADFSKEAGDIKYVWEKSRFS